MTSLLARRTKRTKRFFAKILFLAVGVFIAILVSGITVSAMPLSRKIIVLDAGHGGWDPGMVQGKTEEKHINLSIVQKLQTFLEQGGATVIITRVDDSELSKTKSGDMQVRRLIANTSHADIFVSIHQNAFSKSNVKGAQVFYFNESDNSMKLATCVQSRLREFVDPSNKFKAKANSNYFVLKQTSMPAVLVECGFLTNSSERNKLLNETYQEKIAWGIYLGIIDYFNPPVPEGGTAAFRRLHALTS
ncbi:MAG: N-acetylmuramoyl-L-alanine amidase [Defluviitaleaceae bacterium]|nr:N-acetylmuramoyl-L-alanine amidase [Defluviitaleaceae bacterium]